MIFHYRIAFVTHPKTSIVCGDLYLTLYNLNELYFPNVFIQRKFSFLSNFEYMRSTNGFFSSFCIHTHFLKVPSFCIKFSISSLYFAFFFSNASSLNSIQPNSTQFNPIQPNSTQFNPIQPNSIQFNPIQPNSNLPKLELIT